MEISVSGRLKRAAQITRAASPAAQTPAVKTIRSAKSDRTAWSQHALAFLQEVNRQDMEKQRKLLEAKQKGGSELDALSKSLKVMEQCRKIASRIMKGDKVPPQDEKFLMEADPDGYKLAIACRIPKEKPKEWESVLEEEEQGNGSGSGGAAAESVDSEGKSADSGGEIAEC